MHLRRTSTLRGRRGRERPRAANTRCVNERHWIVFNPTRTRRRESVIVVHRLCLSRVLPPPLRPRPHPFPRIPLSTTTATAAQSITNEEQREAIGAALMDAEEWLYGDGANADLATYKAKLKEVKTTIEPAFFRLEEARERSDLIEKGRDAIAGAKSMVAGWAKSHPQVSA